MTSDTRRIVLWQNPAQRGTDKAHLFWTQPRTDATTRGVWIPRSVVPHVSRDPMRAGELDQRCVVEVEEWWLDKNEL